MEARDLDNLVHRCHTIAKDHGFWEDVTHPESPGVIPVKLMLIVSEAAEALKADRDEHDRQLREMDILEELADVVIRVFDLAHFVSGYGGRASFGDVLLTKVTTNEGRPRLHGKRY